MTFISLVHALLVRRSHVDVSYWDRSEIIMHLQKLHDSTLSLVDLRRHNEHRPLFGIAAVLILASAPHWNSTAEVAANVTIGSLSVGVFSGQAISQSPVRGGMPFWLRPLLMFSPNHSRTRMVRRTT